MRFSLPILLFFSLACSFSISTCARAVVIDDVRTTAELNVCTPANNPPFSFVAADRSVRGIDIEMMQQLGATLKAKVNFVQARAEDIPTSIRAGKCDIGAGGLQVNLRQNQETSFSDAYFVNGVTLVAECGALSRFRSLGDIDRNDIRLAVIRNSFSDGAARQLLTKASVGAVADRNAVLANLGRKSVNAFLTDSVDALSITKQYPGLCALDAGKPLVYGEVAYMLPRGDILTREYIDEWLHQVKASGSFDRILARWTQSP